MTQAEAVAVLDEGWRTVQGLVSRLSEEQAVRRGTIGGGEWSAKDLLAHLAHWEELAQQASEEWRAGREPWIEQVFREKTVDEVNAANELKSLDDSLEAVRERAAQAHSAIIATISRTDDAGWTARAPYPTERRENLGVLLASILGAPKAGFAHASAHIPDLEAYVNSVGA